MGLLIQRKENQLVRLRLRGTESLKSRLGLLPSATTLQAEIQQLESHDTGLSSAQLTLVAELTELARELITNATILQVASITCRDFPRKQRVNLIVDAPMHIEVLWE